MTSTESRRPGSTPAARFAAVASLWLACTALALGADGCDARGATGADPSPAAIPTPSVTAPAGKTVPLDLGRVMRQVHFAFRPDGARFSGGHTTYAVSAGADELRVTPVRPDAPAGAPAAAPFVASVSALERGGAALAGATPQVSLAADATVAIDRGAAVERLESTDDGVEQSFHFAARPTGAGDLVVRLRVSGEAFVGATASGLHFADAASGLGVRYGAATWVDARGRRTPAPLAYDDGAITVTVPAAAVDEAAYPAVLDPVIGPEFAIDAPVPAIAAGTQLSPQVAYGSGAYLAVWGDTRSGAQNIYGVRVSSTGAILDPTGIAITTTLTSSNQAKSPSVAWNGSEWMVTWLEGQEVYCARVSASGVTLDPSGIDVGKGDLGPSIASTGGGFMIARELPNAMIPFTAGPLVVTPVSASGVVSASTQVSANGAGGTLGILAFGGNYNVVFSSNGVVYSRVTPAGVLLDATPQTVSAGTTPLGQLALAASGSSWIVAYTNPSSGTYDLYWTVVGPGGGQGAKAAANQSYPSPSLGVAASGNNFGIFYEDGLQLGAVVVGPNAALLTSATGLTGTNSVGATFGLGAAGDGTNFFAAFVSANSSQVSGLRVGPSLTPLDPAPTLLARGSNNEGAPSAAFNGVDWLVAWPDNKNTNRQIYAARVDTMGTVLDASALAVTAAPSTRGSPRVASNGSGWLVTWVDARNGGEDIYAARVAASGAVLDPNGLALRLGQNAVAPAIASNGTDYFVTWWEDVFSPPQSPSIRGARVTAAGAVLDPGGFQVGTRGVALGGLGSAGSPPGVAYNGTSYLVSWGASASQSAARVTPAGSVLDPGTQAIVVSTKSGGAASVVSDGTNWLVDWGATAARVGPSGSVLDPAGIAVSATTIYGATTAWDGSQYWVVWQTGTLGYTSGISASRVSPGGVVGDPTPLVIAPTPGMQLSPTAAGGPAGKLAVFYQRFDTTAGVDSYRVEGRVVATIDPLGARCVYGAECQSGFCADGVCCDAACTGTCVACTAAKKGSGADGTCGFVAANTDPDNSCPMQAQSTCGTTGVCNGSGACLYYPAGLSCGAVCTGGNAVTSACDGMGTCVAAPPQICAPYACSGGACKTSCATGADCATGAVCIGSTCVVPGPNGAACSVAAACQSGQCVDGVCCNSACAGLCLACSAAKKGQGADGTCGPIAAGLNPDGDCTASPQSTCGESGACNGGGACQLWPQGTPCGATSCQGDVMMGNVCNGQGTCVSNPLGTTCAPYVCAGSGCLTSCATPADCISGYTCMGSTCVPGSASSSSSTGSSSSSSTGSSSSSSTGSSSSSSGGAMACTSPLQCASGFCVDGVCCDSACGSKCFACTAAKKGQGADGTCGPVVAGTDPDKVCAIQVPSTCQQNGACDGKGGCQLWPAGTVCSPATCSGSAQVSASTCDGLGTCQPGSSQSCTAGYLCVGTTCATSCTDNTPCAPGYTCDMQFNACAPNPDAGPPDGGSTTSSSSATSSSGTGTGGATSSSGAGTGGTTSSSGGGAASSGGAGTGGSGGPSTEPEKKGCGCRAAGEPSSPVGGAALVVALAALGSARRRSRGATGRKG